MIHYKSGIFCKACGSLVSIPLKDKFVECQICEVKISLKDIEFQFITSEKTFNNKWVEEFKNKKFKKGKKEH